MKRIAADANLIGHDQAAIILNTGAILEELGGVEGVGFGAAVAHTRELFVMLETDRLTATEVARALRRPLASLVDRIDLAEADELERFVELAELGERFELDARDLASYLDRAARVLEDLGRDSVAERLDDVRVGLAAHTAETETAVDRTMRSCWTRLAWSPGSFPSPTSLSSRSSRATTTSRAARRWPDARS